ncbi:FAD/NAD(P)-binding protein [Streptomyces sp. CRN 30]|uniref:FAD/NAD(P)-binding protein n=1 Tax=Streptomyces sp. CRN 30 TaxID=3075613 RepID=UPI002A7EB90C|nr:FAD/NAD(P)-binding protein [Streptomyces sp. CRN 30]
MTPHCLVVVGGGPMCTYAMAHLAAVLPDASPVRPVRIVVLDRGGRAGAGDVHSDVQPRTSYLNRVAGQIAFAPDESSDPPRKLLPAALRPTFQEWCAQRHAATGHPDFDLRPHDVPKRYVHGLALREMFLRYTELLRAMDGVTVEVGQAEVTGVRPVGDPAAGRFRITTATGDEILADEVLFVTGHSWNTPAPGSEEETLTAHPGYVPTPYPPAERLDESAVPPGRPVAVRGLGLTAIDVLLALTEGRGGTFVPAPDVSPHGLRYVPAGREPSVIVACSPSGVPVSGRPLNAKVADPGLEHSGEFFTVDAVRALRSRVGVPTPDGRRALDFDRHLFPLVALEMAWVHHRTVRDGTTVERLRAAVDAAHRAFLAGRGPWAEDGADALVAALESPLDAADPDRFGWRALLDPMPAASARRDDDGADWARRCAEYLRRDHLDAQEGNLRNAVKAACDGVWRDLRAVFGEAVDFGGLTPESHRRFMRTRMRHYNRLSNGAGLEPMAKMMALLDAGLLDLSVGPEPAVRPAAGGTGGFTVTGGRTGAVRTVDTVVEGRIHPFSPHRDVLPLYRSLLDAGLVRLWRNQGPDGDYEPGALDLTDRFHPVLPDGSSEPRLTFLGAPAEGLRVFQQSAARPHSNSSVLAAAADWAEEAVQRMSRSDASRSRTKKDG